VSVRRTAPLGLTIGALTVGVLAAVATPASAGPGPACEVATIGSVQGSGPASPVVGSTVTVAGTIVGDLPSGVFLQDGGDGDAATSDGLFLDAPDAAGSELGDEVVVRGTVTELRSPADAVDRTLTALTDVTVLECAAGGPAPTAVPLPLPSGDAEREAREGMLVVPTGELTVAGLDRDGEVLLAAGGPLPAPTAVAEPGDPARAVAAENAARSIVLDLAPDAPIRVGDGVDLEPVVLSDSSGWRLQPADGTAAGTISSPADPHLAAPPAVGGDVRVASLALPDPQAEVVAPLRALDADVLTLHGDGPAAGSLLTALAAADGHDWAQVPAATGDSDLIVYRTDRIAPVGDPRTPRAEEAAAFAGARTPVAQTFDVRGEVFSVIATSLTSRDGGTGENADTGDGQGAGNPDRLRQARVLVAFAARVAAESGDDDVLIAGDLNAFRFEDPIDVLTAAGHTDLGPLPAAAGHGSGAPDHVLASPSLVERLTGPGVGDLGAAGSVSVVGLDVPVSAAISVAEPFRGEQVTVTGRGFAPGERVTASLPSLSRGELGAAVADVAGAVAIPVTVPVLLPAGDQEVLLTGTSGETASTGLRLRPLVREVLDRVLGWWRTR
jgi:5'-nucleotidase